MEVIVMQDYQWLMNFGFAAVVSGYLLMRIEPSIKELTKTVNLLTIVVARTSGVDIEELRNITGVN
jgi:hypothetical protein